MLDRLEEVLHKAKEYAKDERTKEIIDDIIGISCNFGYMDWSDWEEYTENELDGDAKELANTIDELVKGE